MAALFGVSRFIGLAANNCLKRVSTGLFAEQLSLRPRNLSERLASSLKNRVSWIPQKPQWQNESQTEILDTTVADYQLMTAVVDKINQQVTTNNTSRLFAVVHVCGKQFKVTEHDVIVIQGYWAPNPGDELKFEKVLMVGGTDFTLVGRPILNRELVTVDGTIIEKTFSHTKTRFRMRKRKQYKRIHFYRIPHTMVRINSISINGKIDDKKDVEGLDRIY